MMISILLCALGNRFWGWGKIPGIYGHLIGLLIMSTGVAWHYESPIYGAIALIGLGVWRWYTPTAWHALMNGGHDWVAAIFRGMFIMFYAFCLSLHDESAEHLFWGLICTIAVPACYWLAGKVKYMKDNGALAELLAGACVGMI